MFICLFVCTLFLLLYIIIEPFFIHFQSDFEPKKKSWTVHIAIVLDHYDPTEHHQFYFYKHIPKILILFISYLQ